MEERLTTAGLREALNEQTWNQLKHFAGRMEELGISWETPVKIAGVWADVDRTQTHPDLSENGLSPTMVQNYVWIMGQGGTVGAISAAPYRVMDILNPNFYFPASLDQRVVGRIRKAVTSPEDMQHLRVLARSGGIDVRFASTGEESLTLSPILFSPEEITKVSKELAIAALNAISRKDGTDFSSEIDQLKRASEVLSVAEILRRVERAKELILLPGITPLEIDGGMIFLSFQDGVLDSEAILAEARPLIEKALSDRTLHFIRGPMYVAVSLFQKTETLRGVIEEPSEKPGVWIVLGDGPNDDLPMLKMAAGSQRLVLPYFVGPPEAVAETDAVVVPRNRRFVEATEWFLAQVVSAAQTEKPYAELPFIAGEITPRELADALDIPLNDLSARIRGMDYSQAAALLATAGVEESVAKPKAAPTIWWAGDLPMVPAISGDPKPLLVSLDIHAPNLQRNELRSSLELRLLVRVNGEQREFPVEPEQMQLGEGWYGPYHNNYRIQSELPAEVRANLETVEHVRFWFKYRLKGEADWKDTSEENKQNGVGEIVHQPNWLFNSAMYTLNAKAWGSFESIEKRLPELQQLGAKILLLQGIHPGHTAFEIDDYEIADPALGGEQGLRRLLQEAKQRGFRVVIPFVPGHSSPKNKLLQESPHLYKKASAESPALDTVAVDVKGAKEIFLRGNVYLDGRLPGEIPGGFGPGTVQFDLWDPANREELAAYWGRVLGQWARFGIDGFYADTGHSIHRVAPGWLEEIQRRIRSEHPDTILGFEAHWFEAGGFVARGGSFAQEFALYNDWFREILYGRKDAAGLMRHLQQLPAWFLQSQLTFIQNHDEDPVDLHLEWSPVAPALKADAHRAIAALLLLGVPGIPLMTSGQESGLKERWNGTGHPGTYDNQWDWGRAPNAPRAPLFDPFSDTSSEAGQMRQAYSELLRIRQANPAFWWADGARFLPTSDPRTFAAYRAAGTRRALVLIRLDTSARDSAQATPVVVDLSALKLGSSEAASFGESLKKPSLVLPASDSLGWNAGAEAGNVTSLSVQLKPFQATVLEFEGPLLAAAGVEESGQAFVFPTPGRWDGARLKSRTVYGQGGKPSPSTGEGFLKTIFKRPDQSLLPVRYEVWGQEIPPELQNGSREEAIDKLLSKDQLGQVYLPDAAKSQPEAVRKLLEILGLRSPALKVHYQIFQRGGGAPRSRTVETRPVSIRLYQSGGTRGGSWQMEIRYEAQVPIEEVADYTFAAEVIVPSVSTSPAPWVSPVIDLRVPPLFRQLRPDLVTKPMSPDEVPKLPSKPKAESSVPPEPEHFRILQQGWFRVSDGSEVGSGDSALIPLELKQSYLHDGRFLQIALYSSTGNRLTSWSGTGLGRRLPYAPSPSKTLLDSLVDE
ncbi:MAG: alpha-amylase family glycosyl hydrolase, partial [Candidatus Omnitrophota bacterium]|nr:alpha-amylase family glycosyl hydrolase [Candidatus Omnitrophota bacterium]